MHMHRAATLRFGLAALAACNAPATATAPAPGAVRAPAAALSVARPFLVPGETITWSVSFAGVEAAQARMAVGEVGGTDGHHEVVMRSEVRAAGLLSLVSSSEESVTSWIDTATGVPTLTEYSTHSAQAVEQSRITRGQGKATKSITTTKLGEGPRPPLILVQNLPAAAAHDQMSALATIRAWDAPPGTRATLWAYGGVQLWRTSIVVGTEDTLDTELGRMRARKLVATSVRLKDDLSDDPRPPRSWSIWLSSDERRIPVRIEAHLDFGDVIIRATSYATSPGEE